MSYDAILQVSKAEEIARANLLEAQNRARERIAAAQNAAEQKLADVKKQLGAETAEALAEERKRNEAYAADPGSSVRSGLRPSQRTGGGPHGCSGCPSDGKGNGLMALVTMKRLSVLAPAERRRPVLRRACAPRRAELERAAPQLFADTGGALRPQEENTGAAEIRARLTAAHSALDAAAPQKTSFFGARMTMTERQLFDSASLEAANRAAVQIEALVREPRRLRPPLPV